jgi:hypothetical protein
LLGDVQDLVKTGFLTDCVRIGNSYLIFKTINSVELHEIDERVPETRFRIDGFRKSFWMLAFAIYKIDGQNMLFSRPNSLDYLNKQFWQWPQTILVHLLEILNSLMQRSVEALEKVKMWVPRLDSRLLWRAVMGFPLCDSKLTGILGTEKLGLNEAQIVWVALNRVLDNYEEYWKHLSNAALIASATNPKGMRSLNQSIRSQEQSYKQMLKDWERGDAPRDEVVKVARSVEDLLEQKRREEQGIKDEHDGAIERLEQGIRDTVLSKLERAREKVRRGEEEVVGILSTQRKIITSDEMERQVQEQRSRVGKPSSQVNKLYIDDPNVQKVLGLMNSPSAFDLEPPLEESEERPDVKRVPGIRRRNK